MRRGGWLVAAVFALAAAVLWWWRADGGTPAPKRTHDAAPFAWTLRLRPDAVYRYRLDYASTQDLLPLAGLGGGGQTEMQADVSYRGELWLRALQPPDANGNLRAGMRLAACESATVELSGQSLLDETGDCAAELAPHELEMVPTWIRSFAFFRLI
jgi:hypothetical protein